MEKIIFASGDYPYFGGAATNIYGLVKYFKSIKYNVIGLILNPIDLTKELYDPENTGCIYHIKNFDNKNKIKEDIIKMLNGFPTNIYIKKAIIGINLKDIFIDTNIYYIFSSVISSEYNFKNIDNELNNIELIPDIIKKISIDNKIIVNSNISKKILLNYNKNTNINIAYTSFLINNNNNIEFFNHYNKIYDNNWDKRKYDIGFVSSCCNRFVKNIKLFNKIITNIKYINNNKIIIGKNSSLYSNSSNTECYDLLEHSDLIEKLKNTKLIIITSFYESLSNLMIESIHYGCNILINDNIGGREFISDNCVANDYDELINKTDILIKKRINCINNNFNYTIDDLKKNLFL